MAIESIRLSGPVPRASRKALTTQHVPWGWRQSAFWQAHDAPIFKIEWSPDGRAIATAASDGLVRTWTANGMPRNTMRSHTQGVVGLAWSPDSNLLASSGKDRVVCVWSGGSGALIKRLAVHSDRVYGLAWNSDGTLLVSGSDDATVRLWDTRTWECRILRAPSPVWSIIHSPATNTFIAGCENGDLLLCSLDGAIERVRSTVNAGVYSLVLLDGCLAVGTTSALLFRNIANWKEVHRIHEYKTHISRLSVSRSRQILASRGLDNGTARLRKIGEWDEVGTIEGLSKDRSAALAFHPHDFELALTSNDSTDVIIYTLDEQIAAGSICRRKMQGERLCSRPLADGNDQTPKRCVLHSEHQALAERRRVEFTTLLDNGGSEVERIDCTGFFIPPMELQGSTINSSVIFDEAHFQGAQNFSHVVFKGSVSCKGAHFEGPCKLDHATFEDRATFDGTTFSDISATQATFAGSLSFTKSTLAGRADFSGSLFHQAVSFTSTRFGGAASFVEAHFVQQLDFVKATLDQEGNDFAILDFSDARFDAPERVLFRSLNRDAGLAGVKMRLVNCNIEQARFDDINWWRESGRLVLQDERDVVLHWKNRTTPELVAIAYRRLMTSFDTARSFDLAEECFGGFLDLKAADSSIGVVSRWTIKAYGVASSYGSSYVRAMAWLSGMVLLIFPLLLWFAGASPAPPFSGAVGANAVWSGLYCSIQAVSFASQASCGDGNAIVSGLGVLERIVVPAQVALLLLALRRRLRR